ncbi:MULTISPECIES: hypothetical protein [Rhodomicrobium]|uniref:hypothetical protein n=1 Tax=Rhodomicrobium TaxID=1068 RepID=UPI000B4AC333|nr:MULTISPECIES: hypothetical protein [Rhodomicrobium]
MKPTPKSVNEPRYSGSGNRANSTNSAGTNSVARRPRQQSSGRISPWLPIALAGFALLVVARAAAAQERHRPWHDRLLSQANNRWQGIWPDLRDTAEETGSRAKSWFYDNAPSRRSISDFFSSSSDWLPDANVNKRRLMANFDWSNPPRWLRDIDLSTSGKRRRFIRDLKRYGSRQSDSLMSSLGLR